MELLPSAFVERKILRRIRKENRWTTNGPWNTPAERNHCSNPRQAQPTCFQRYLSCSASLWINEFGAFERIFQRRSSRALPLLWCSVFSSKSRGIRTTFFVSFLTLSGNSFFFLVLEQEILGCSRVRIEILRKFQGIRIFVEVNFT